MSYYHICSLLCGQEKEDAASEKVRKKKKLNFFFLTTYLKASTVIFLPAMKTYLVVKQSSLGHVYFGQNYLWIIRKHKLSSNANLQQYKNHWQEK